MPNHQHFIGKCKHGVVRTQCRCPSKDKVVQEVACGPECAAMTGKPDRLRSVEEVAKDIMQALFVESAEELLALDRRAAMRRGMEIAREACLLAIAPQKTVYTAQVAGIVADRADRIRALDLESLLEAE